jgi:hypothetical protein
VLHLKIFFTGFTYGIKYGRKIVRDSFAGFVVTLIKTTSGSKAVHAKKST